MKILKKTLSFLRFSITLILLLLIVASYLLITGVCATIIVVTSVICAGLGALVGLAGFDFDKLQKTLEAGIAEFEKRA